MFKNIPSFNGEYQVDKNGKVRNRDKKIMKTFFNKEGYERVSLIKNGVKKNYYVHYLVCLTFLKNQHDYSDINHKNHIRNDNRVENLQWCTEVLITQIKSRKFKHCNNVLKTHVFYFLLHQEFYMFYKIVVYQFLTGNFRIDL